MTTIPMEEPADSTAVNGGSMKKISSYDEFLRAKAEYPKFLLYLSSSTCSVCRGIRPRVEKMAEEFDFPLLEGDVEEVREVAGQLSVFTVPALLLFYRGREYHRQARIPDFNELEKRMAELKERG